MATTPTTLYEYYTQKGQKLPPWKERAPIYESFGLGKASEYIGSAQQNVDLLQKLISGAGEEKTPITGGVEGEKEFPGLGDVIKDKALGVEEGKPLSPEDQLIQDWTTKLGAYTAAPSLTEEKERLEEEKGVPGMRERVGSFEEEITKTQTLLDQLEEDITVRTREYLVSEPQRRRVYAAEQEPLLKGLGIAERGLAGATGRLERTEQDILTELGLIEKERTMPLDLFEREINIRSKIKSLTDEEIPGVVSSTFDDEGNLTIVTQDPTTGAFSTQTLKGIGTKAQKYQSISTATDDQGNLTIIGITRDGESEVIGTFKGVGGTAGAGTQKQIRSYINSIRDSYMATKGKAEGYRENLIESLVAEAGEENRDFITNEVYTQLPDITAAGVGEEQFLTKEWFIKTYGEDALIKKAKLSVEEGGGGKGAWTKSGRTEMDEYLDDIMKAVEAWRQVGKTDKEILEEMMK